MRIVSQSIVQGFTTELTFETSNCCCQGIVHFGEIDHDGAQMAGIDGVLLVSLRLRVEGVVPLRAQLIPCFNLHVDQPYPRGMVKSCTASVPAYVDDVLWQRHP
jgi:hypothetical protein